MQITNTKIPKGCSRLRDYGLQKIQHTSRVVTSLPHVSPGMLCQKINSLIHYQTKKSNSSPTKSLERNIKIKLRVNGGQRANAQRKHTITESFYQKKANNMPCSVAEFKF